MDFITNLDASEITAVAGSVAAAVWAAYQDFSNQPAWKKALMILAPIAALGVVLAIVG